MLSLPIYRAKKIDSDEYVKGYLHRSNLNPNFITIRTGNIKIVNGVVIDEMFKIDPSTLAISFDGGENWFDMENAEREFREYLKTHGYEYAKVTGIQQ